MWTAYCTQQYPASQQVQGDIVVNVKEDLLWKWEFRKLDEILDVDGEVFSIFEQRLSVKTKC